MKYLKIAFVIVFALNVGLCQSQDLKWASDFGSKGSNNTSALCIKAAGNGDYLVTGILRGTLDFDFSAAGTATLSTTNDDVFIARYSSTGNFIWVKLLKGINGYYESSDPILTVDKDNNIWLAMRSDATVDFDPSAGEYKLSSAYNNTEATYLAKYDGSGSFLWAKKFDAERGLYPSHIETDASGNIYLTGGYYYNQDFDFTSGTTTLYGSSQVSTVFLAKYNTSGSLTFAKTLISTSQGAGVESMKLVNNSELVFVGGFTGGNFDTEGTTPKYLSGGSNGSYIAKYTTNGAYVCANSMYISQYRGYVHDVTVDSDGNMYAVGDFSESIDFNGPTNAGQNIAAKGSYSTDGFVVKYNAQAEVVWYFSMGSVGGTYDVACRAAAIDSKNNLQVVGLYSAEVDFDPSLASYKSLVNNANPAIFIASYNSNKEYISANQITVGDVTMVSGMLMNASDEFVIQGLAYRATDVDPSPNEVLMNPSSDNQLAYYISVYGLATTTTPPVTTSLTDHQTASFHAYPNPVSGDILYITGLDNAELNEIPVITTLDGQNVSFTYTQDQEKMVVDVNGLNKGMYFVTIGGQTIKIIR